MENYKRDTKLIAALKQYGDVITDQPMSRLTSFKTGGPADILVRPADETSVRDIYMLSYENDIPLTVIGGCSNLLVGDLGIRGIVIQMDSITAAGNGIRLLADDVIYSGSGIKKEDFIGFSIKNSFTGMEFMAGIPGCIGGGIVMNAGTDKATFSDVLKSVKYINNDGSISEKEITGVMGKYRHLDIEDMGIVLSGCFRLEKSDNAEKVKNDISMIIKERRAKHPLDYPSAGSVFKNPDGHSSWKLVNDAGLKGKMIGGAMISDLHTNFIINYDNATSKDILNLIEYTREKVLDLYNIRLETEIRMIGEF